MHPSKDSDYAPYEPPTNGIQMTNFDIVDRYFVRICESPSESLDPDSAALVEVWHSFGVIQNGGLHGYLCELGEGARDIARHYEHLGLTDGAEAIHSALLLWLKYWPDLPPDDSDPDDFRRQFDLELNALEDRFYALAEAVPAALAVVARKKEEG